MYERIKIISMTKSIDKLISEVDSIFKEREALERLEAMSDEEFSGFLWSLPVRVQMLVRANMAEWRNILPGWYLKRKRASEPVSVNDLPF